MIGYKMRDNHMIRMKYSKPVNRFGSTGIVRLKELYEMGALTKDELIKFRRKELFKHVIN